MSHTGETSSIAFATAHPGNRWRLYAVAACGSAVRGQHEADLYVGRLRARQAQTPIPTYGRRRGWLKMPTCHENRVIQSFV
jgi:hypothetical protein